MPAPSHLALQHLALVFLPPQQRGHFPVHERCLGLSLTHLLLTRLEGGGEGGVGVGSVVEVRGER